MENTLKQKEHNVFKVAVAQMKRHTVHTAGYITVNMITQYRTPTALATCLYSIVTGYRV